MKKLLLTLLTALMVNAAWSGPVEDARAAAVRKDFATFLQIIRPPALKSEAWAQSWLADLYAAGYGLAQDYAEGARWHTTSSIGYRRAKPISFAPAP